MAKCTCIRNKEKKHFLKRIAIKDPLTNLCYCIDLLSCVLESPYTKNNITLGDAFNHWEKTGTPSLSLLMYIGFNSSLSFNTIGQASKRRNSLTIKQRNSYITVSLPINLEYLYSPS